MDAAWLIVTRLGFFVINADEEGQCRVTYRRAAKTVSVRCSRMPEAIARVALMAVSSP